MSYSTQRRSSDSVWPLRAADGRTFAQVKRDLEQQKKNKEQADAAVRDQS